MPHRLENRIWLGPLGFEFDLLENRISLGPLGFEFGNRDDAKIGKVGMLSFNDIERARERGDRLSEFD